MRRITHRLLPIALLALASNTGCFAKCPLMKEFPKDFRLPPTESGSPNHDQTIQGGIEEYTIPDLGTPDGGLDGATGE